MKETLFFSYKLMPVKVDSFTEYLVTPNSYSKRQLVKHVKEELLTRKVDVDLSVLSFNVKEGHLFAEGFGFSTK